MVRFVLAVCHFSVLRRGSLRMVREPCLWFEPRRKNHVVPSSLLKKIEVPKLKFHKSLGKNFWRLGYFFEWKTKKPITCTRCFWYFLFTICLSKGRDIYLVLIRFAVVGQCVQNKRIFILCSSVVLKIALITRCVFFFVIPWFGSWFWLAWQTLLSK